MNICLIGWTQAAAFLSCLRGSELTDGHCRLVSCFLSCLRGSEPTGFHNEASRLFLSCLRGSERGPSPLVVAR